jgi:DNA polymerase-3 subunit delta'
MGDLNSIVGHESVVEHLKNAVQMNKVSHAYIISGQKGAGKKTIAGAFAKMLQCECDDPFGRPCGKCHSCLQAESGNNPDIIWVRHDKTASIGVDDVRAQLVSDMQIKPYSSRYKIYIVDEAEKLTQQAQNAMLKTIEEPPAYGIIILLTTNAEAFLPTILSRCVTHTLKPISSALIEKYLMEQYKIVDYQAKFAAAFSQGRLGRAISIVTADDFTEFKDEVIHVLRYIDDMEITEIVAAVKDAAKYKQTIEDYIDLMIMWYRDVLLYKSTNDVNSIIFKDDLKYIRKNAMERSYQGLDNIITAMNKAKIRLAANVNFDLVMELMLLTIKEKDNG